MQPTFAAQLAPGQVVAGGRYQLMDVLGRGGFGVVYRADQRALGREVALKVLIPQAREPEKALLRFRREAEMAQRLEHPNTVRVYDFGQLETGHWYIALEILRGRSLDVAIRQGAFSAGRTARVAMQILKSLMEAHARGVVHRDLKPQNVFLCDFPGETDFVKVLDFGVAKLRDDDDGKPVTQGGQMVGTPAYMAPEQVLGAPVGPSTDIYALGLIIAECLSGRPVIGEMAAIQACMLQSSPAVLELPGGLAMSPFGAIVSRAIQKNPAARYHSAGDMLREMENVLTVGSGATAVATVALPRAVAFSSGPPAATPPPPAPFTLAPIDTTATNLAQRTLTQASNPVTVVLPRGMLAALIALGVGFVLLAGAAIFAVAESYTKNKTTAATDTATVPGSAVDQTPAFPVAKLGAFDMDQATERLRKIGYTVMPAPPNTGHGYTVTSVAFYTATNPPETGSFQLMTYDDPKTLDAAEAMFLRDPKYRMARDEHRLLLVMSYDPSKVDRLAKIALEK